MSALAFFGASVVAVSLLLALAAPSPGSVPAKVLQLISVDDEQNLWSWYSSALLTLAAAGFACLALRQPASGRRRAYVVFALVSAYLSLDETVQLHERLSWRLPAFQTVVGAWLVIALPIVVGVGVGLLVLGRSIPATLRRPLIAAGAVYLLGAAGLEAAAGLLSITAGVGRGDPVYIVESHLEELLEFTGIFLSLRAIVGQLQRPVSTMDAGVVPTHASAVPVEPEELLRE